MNARAAVAVAIGGLISLVWSLPAGAAAMGRGGGGGFGGGMRGFSGGMGRSLGAPTMRMSAPSINRSMGAPSMRVAGPTVGRNLGAPAFRGTAPIVRGRTGIPMARLGMGNRGIGGNVLRDRDHGILGNRFRDRDRDHDRFFRHRRFDDDDDFALGLIFGFGFPYATAYPYPVYEPYPSYPTYSYPTYSTTVVQQAAPEAVLLSGLALSWEGTDELLVSWSGQAAQISQVAFSLLDTDRQVIEAKVVRTPPYTTTFDRVSYDAAYLQLAIQHRDGSVDTAVQPLPR